MTGSLWSTAQFLSSSGYFVYDADLCAHVNVCSPASVSRHTSDPRGVHLSHTHSAPTPVPEKGETLSCIQNMLQWKRIFFRLFFHFWTLTQKFLRKMFSVVVFFFFFPSKRMFKASKHSPFSFISFFLFSPLTVLTSLSPSPEFVLPFFLMI